LKICASRSRSPLPTALLQDAKPNEMQQGERKTRSKTPHQVNLALISEIVYSYDPVSFNEANDKEE
jgi:hypothetical protein